MTSEFDIKILTLYIAVWSWHIIASIFFVGAILLLALPPSTIRTVFFFAFFVGFMFCEVNSLRRRRDIEDE